LYSSFGFQFGSTPSGSPIGSAGMPSVHGSPRRLFDDGDDGDDEGAADQNYIPNVTRSMEGVDYEGYTNTIGHHLDEAPQNVAIIYKDANRDDKVFLTSITNFDTVGRDMFVYECKASVPQTALLVNEQDVFPGALVNLRSIGFPVDGFVNMSNGLFQTGTRVYFLRYLNRINRVASHYVVYHDRQDPDFDIASRVHCGPGTGGEVFELIPLSTPSSFGRRRRPKKRTSFGRRVSKSKSKKRASFGRRTSQKANRRR
jgi:hypothetical protein